MLAHKGEIHIVVGKDYFSYMTDNSENICDLSEGIKKETAKAKQPNNWNVWNWFENIKKKCRVSRLKNIIV